MIELLAVRYLSTKMCRRGAEPKLRRLATEFWEQEHFLDRIDTFKCISEMLLFDQKYCTAVAGNL